MLYSIFDRFTTRGEANRLKELTGLGLGWKVGEVGSGNGQFAKALLRLVGEQGKVYASEFGKEKLEKLSKTLPAAKYPNISLLESTATCSKLESLDLDLIVMRKVYHHFTDPDAMNKSFFNALKPGGKLIVIDFAPKLLLKFSTPQGIPSNRGGHGIKKELVISEALSAGFTLKKQIDNWAMGGIYLLMFEK